MIYAISKNSHYCTPRRIRMVSAKTMSGSFRLDLSCWYDTAQVGTHINKLTGYSVDLFNKNSVRLGWRPAKEHGKFDIFCYIHIGGVYVQSHPLKDDLIATVDDTTQFYTIQINDGGVPGFFGRLFGRVAKADQTVTFVVGAWEKVKSFNVSLGTGWLMYFYFGGKPTSPQDMVSEVENNF